MKSLGFLRRLFVSFADGRFSAARIALLATGSALFLALILTISPSSRSQSSSDLIAPPIAAPSGGERELLNPNEDLETPLAEPQAPPEGDLSAAPSIIPGTWNAIGPAP